MKDIQWRKKKKKRKREREREPFPPMQLKTYVPQFWLNIGADFVTENSLEVH